MDTFDLDSSIDDISKSLGQIYKGVKLAQAPSSRWVQIVNDTTILGEEIRRGRTPEAADRSARILMRLLEFVGYYLYVYEPTFEPKKSVRLRDFVAHAFRSSSVKYLDKSRPPEGFTRWILGKYPFACAKCGYDKCHCLVEPWVFEERRQNPKPWNKYKARTDARLEKLKVRWEQRNEKKLTLCGLFDHFNKIYRASRYHQEPWKLAMHLAEEMGEATIALSRMELAFVCWKGNFPLQPELEKIEEIVRNKIADLTKPMAQTEKERFKDKANSELRNSIAELQSADSWRVLAGYTGDRLKEELCDVLSWLVALIYKLRSDKRDDVLESLKANTTRYIKQSEGTTTLQCPWCTTPCSDGCLVRHAVASELGEKVLKF